MPGRRGFTFLVGGVLFLALDFGAKSLDRWLRPPPPPQTHLSIRVAHPEYDHGIRPNAAGRESYGSQSANYFSNSLGLRDEEIREVPLQSNLPRFLFMGDSMTEAGPVPWEKTFVGRLQERWQGQADVLNGAVVDFGPSLILPKLRTLMEREQLQTDYVVVVLNPSIIRTAYTYVEGENGRVQHRRYGPYQDRADFLGRTEKVEAWLENGVERRFVLLGALVRNLRLTWRKWHPATRAMDRLKMWVEDPFRANAEEQGLMQTGIRRTEASLDRILEFLKSRNSSLILVFLPWPKMILNPANGNQIAEDLDVWAKKRRVLFLDLSAEMRQQGNLPEVVGKYFLRNDNHFTEEGHAWVADMLAEKISPGSPVRPETSP
jgi:hypothetical protein